MGARTISFESATRAKQTDFLVSDSVVQILRPETFGLKQTHELNLKGKSAKVLADELTRLLDSLSRRIVRVLARRGLLIADLEYPSLDWVPDSSLDHLQAASVSYRIAIGPHAGRKALTLYSLPPLDEAPNHSLLARLAGFSLYAATACEAHQRSRLGQLCRSWPN